MLNDTLTDSFDCNIIVDYNYEYMNTTISLRDIYNDTIYNGTIVSYINENPYSIVNITRTNLNFKVSLNQLNMGNNNIIIKYYSDEYNYQNTTTFNINIKKLNTTIITSPVMGIGNEKTELTAVTEENANSVNSGKVIFKINNNKLKSNNNKQYILTLIT